MPIEVTLTCAFTKERTIGCTGPQRRKGKSIQLGSIKSLHLLSVLSQISLRVQIPLEPLLMKSVGKVAKKKLSSRVSVVGAFIIVFYPLHTVRQLKGVLVTNPRYWSLPWLIVASFPQLISSSTGQVEKKQDEKDHGLQ